MDHKDTIAYINAGGRGTRLYDIFTPSSDKGVAKALLEIGEPRIKLIDHHINNLREQGFDMITVATGDQREVREYLEERYDGSDLFITHSNDQLGTGGDIIKYAKSINHNRNLLIQNVDTVLDINLKEFSRSFEQDRNLGAIACISLTTNTGVPNEGAYHVNVDGIVVSSREFFNCDDADNTVTKYEYKASSTGAVLLRLEYLSRYMDETTSQPYSLYRDILADVWRERKLIAYNNGNNFFRDVGTVASWNASINDVALHRLLCYNTDK